MAKKNDFDVQKITDTLMNLCRKAGPFNPSYKIKGLGCNIDSDRLILHCGNELYCEGQKMNPLDFDSQFIYEIRESLNLDLSQELNDEEASSIIKATNTSAWGKKHDGDFFAGFLALGPIAGALPWRPHIWLEGTKGSGKSTLLNKIARPLIGKLTKPILGGTSEAGIRQVLGQDSLVVLYDESESSDSSGKHRNETILFLVRAASSSGGGKIIKGTPGHKAIEFEVRSMFCFSATTVSLEHAADKSRFTELNVRKISPQRVEELFKTCSTFDASFQNRLVARSYFGAKRIIDNALKLSDAIAIKYPEGGSRFGDQYGYLIAGCESLKSKAVISNLGEANTVLDNYDLIDYLDSSSQEYELLSLLLQLPMKAPTSDGFNTDLFVGEAIRRLHKQDRFEEPKIELDTLDKELGLRGFKYIKEDELLLISNTAQFIKRGLKDSTVPSNWHKVLQRLAGAKPSLGTIYFGPGLRTRAIEIPVDLVISQEHAYGNSKELGYKFESVPF